MQASEMRKLIEKEHGSVENLATKIIESLKFDEYHKRLANNVIGVSKTATILFFPRLQEYNLESNTDGTFFQVYRKEGEDRVRMSLQLPASYTYRVNDIEESYKTEEEFFQVSLFHDLIFSYEFFKEVEYLFNLAAEKLKKDMEN